MKHSVPPGLPGLILLLLVGPLAHATPSFEAEPFARGGTVFTVGPDAACDYESLQVAINAATGPTTIRLMNNYAGTNSPYTITSKSLLIIGGYASCTAGAPLVGRTRLSGQGSRGVMSIRHDPVTVEPDELVILSRLDLADGAGSDPGNAGGLLVEGRAGALRVVLDDVLVENNNRLGIGNHGGGIRLVQTSAPLAGAPELGPMLALLGSRVVGNQSADRGGGVACISLASRGSVELLQIEGGMIQGNSADSGGGLYLRGCSGVNLRLGGLGSGLLGNSAANYGGGIFLELGAQAEFDAPEVQLDGRRHGGVMRGNQAPRGGALAVLGGGSVLQIRNSWLVENSASVIGSAAVAQSGGRYTFDRTDFSESCAAPAILPQDLFLPPCSVIQANHGSAPIGLLGAPESSTGQIDRTLVRHNQGSDTTVQVVANASGGEQQLGFTGSLFHDNPGPTLFFMTGRFRLDLVHVTAVHAGSFAPIDIDFTEGTATVNVMASILAAVDNGSPLVFGAQAGDIVEAECLLSNRPEDESGFLSPSLYLAADPRFVNPAAADYRLTDDSAAIDFCYAVLPADEISPDLAGQARGAVWTGPIPPVNPASGLFDLGAFEAIYIADRIFGDRFAP